jgi:cytochrome P450
MARLEEMYENPLKFDPERWFLSENAKKTLFEYPVFQAGPRTCLGMNMAYYESKLMITMILQRFLVRVKPGTVAFPAESLTMPISGGLPVTIHKREAFFDTTSSQVQSS